MEWIAQAVRRAKCFGGLQGGVLKRRFDRYTIPADYDIEVRVGEHTGKLAVLSEGGACVVQLWSFRERPPVTLPVTFALPPENSVVELRATVCWIDSLFSAGLHFVDLSQEARLSIMRFILNDSRLQSEDCLQEPPELPEPSEKDRDQSILQAAKRAMLPGLGNREFDAALNEFAETACWSAKASGVVIALGDGSKFVCRASVACAPPLGSEVSHDFGLFHECIRSQQVVLCVDGATDLRVGPALYDRYHVRSVCLVPLLAGEVVLGCVGVFRDRPSQFAAQDIQKLQMLAQSIVYSILRRS